MYLYEWDPETGGLLLLSTQSQFSKEPRPVYYQELDMLGFDRYWKYEKDDSAPYMWAEASNYYYFGRQVAQTIGGTLFKSPELVIKEQSPEPDNAPLRQVDVQRMVEKNSEILDALINSTIKMIYNTYIEYRKKIDVFYVAFSGGKDSVVALDLVSRALPHDEFCVLFGDTGMESKDTYCLVEKIQSLCKDEGISFYRSHSKQNVDETWSEFGPPSVTNRWCCSVHKTTPQILYLRELTKNPSFRGMAFTGVRGDESLKRSEYEEISFGEKHKGQYSCHPILHWSSAELYLYIFRHGLIINEAYKKGNSRVGCLVCPMSSGKHEYVKNICYPEEVSTFLSKIKQTSGKTYFSEAEMERFIDDGNWKKRRTGRELNFGEDLHYFEKDKGIETMYVKKFPEEWKQWAKTIGRLTEITESLFSLSYKGFEYTIQIEDKGDEKVITFPNCGTTKNDIKFISLFRGVVIKSIYCVRCGVCVAECNHGCIDMSDGVKISDACVHCHQCHEVHEHCVRYNSIRNKMEGGSSMDKKESIDRYAGFGIRGEWMDTYFASDDVVAYWDNTTLGTKMIPAFRNFLQDAGVLPSGKGVKKNEKYLLTDFGKKMQEMGTNSAIMWALMLCNLVYHREFKWFIDSIDSGRPVTPEEMDSLLMSEFENDAKGHGRENVINAFKFILITTPIGKELGFGECDYTSKQQANGDVKIFLNSISRGEWQNPDPLVILYSLYKYAEACGGYYHFTLSTLMDESIESDGVSPARIFGLSRETLGDVLQKLSANHQDFINASFTLGLDNINLREDKTSADVLALFD